MSQIEIRLLPWHYHLCEYYGVTPEKALELGTRSTGRKPDLPGSTTTQAVSGMTYEDIWESRERKSIEDVFQFYKDQGAWSTFRQCVRHKDLIELHINLLTQTVALGSHVCEYGSGVAPYMNTLLQAIPDNSKLDVSIVDVDCEHFTFGQWRLNDIKEKRGLENVSINAHPAQIDSLPTFHKPLDTVFLFEVVEHTPDPVAVITNLHAQMNDGACLVENFILANDVLEAPEFDGPDLRSAALLRDDYLAFIKDNFVLLTGEDPEESFRNNPSATRAWRKK
ncbi:MAG: hypothetical protein VXZ72_03530 [Chlamydiota bacterium]|nr:hypothetical protein [Chlamydiota bacterium]